MNKFSVILFVVSIFALNQSVYAKSNLPSATVTNKQKQTLSNRKTGAVQSTDNMHVNSLKEIHSEADPDVAQALAEAAASGYENVNFDNSVTPNVDVLLVAPVPAIRNGVGTPMIISPKEGNAIVLPRQRDCSVQFGGRNYSAEFGYQLNECN